MKKVIRNIKYYVLLLNMAFRYQPIDYELKENILFLYYEISDGYFTLTGIYKVKNFNKFTISQQDTIKEITRIFKRERMKNKL